MVTLFSWRVCWDIEQPAIVQQVGGYDVYKGIGYVCGLRSFGVDMLLSLKHFLYLFLACIAYIASPNVEHMLYLLF